MEITEVRPKLLKAEHMCKSTICQKAMKDTPTEVSEAEDNKDGKYMTLHSNNW